MTDRQTRRTPVTAVVARDRLGNDVFEMKKLIQIVVATAGIAGMTGCVSIKMDEKRQCSLDARPESVQMLSERLQAASKLPDTDIWTLLTDSIGDELAPDDPRYRNNEFVFAPPEKVLALLFHLYRAQGQVSYKQMIMRSIAETCQPFCKERMSATRALSENEEIARILLAQMDDDDPYVRFWAVRAGAGLGLAVPRDTVEKLLKDTSVRTRHETQRYLPRLLSSAGVPGNREWIDSCLKAVKKGDLLEQAGGLRALEDFALTYTACLLERYARASEAEKIGLEWALMQVPDLPVWIDYCERSEPDRQKHPLVFGQLLVLHQAWWFTSRSDKLLPDSLDDPSYRMIQATLSEVDWSDKGLASDWGKYDVLKRPLLVLAYQKTGDGCLRALLPHDKATVQTIVTQEMHGFPAQLRYDSMLSLVQELDATPELIAATTLAHKWMAEDRYLLHYCGEKVKTAVAGILEKAKSRPEQGKKRAGARRKGVGWYRQCAANVDSEDLAVSAGAVNGLLWSDERGANEIVGRLKESERGSRAFRVLLGLGLLNAFVPKELEDADAADNPGLKTLQEALSEREEALLAVVDAGHIQSYTLSEAEEKQQNIDRHGSAFDALYMFSYSRNNLDLLIERFSKQQTSEWNGLLLSQMTGDSGMATLIPEKDADAFIPYIWRGVSTRQRYRMSDESDLFDAIARFEMVEAIPLLVRYAVRNTSWPDEGLDCLGHLGCPEAIIDLERYWHFIPRQPEAKARNYVLWNLRAETAAAQFRLGDLRGLARALAIRPYVDSYVNRIPILCAAKAVTSWPEAWPTGWNGDVVDSLESSFLRWLPDDLGRLKWDPKARKYRLDGVEGDR